MQTFTHLSQWFWDRGKESKVSDSMFKLKSASNVFAGTAGGSGTGGSDGLDARQGLGPVLVF